MKFSGGRLCALASLASLVLAGFESHAWAESAKRNKVIIYPSANETIGQLKQQGVAKVDDYGSYWIAEVSDQDLGKLKASHGDRVITANHLNRIELAATNVDTTVGEPAIPANLQQVDEPGKRLRLVQFEGPIRVDWLRQVKAAGDVKIVNYVPNNAYVVYLDAAAEKNLDKLKAPNGPIQWIGKYHPFYKISRGLRQATSRVIKVRVVLFNGPNLEQSEGRVQSFALRGIESREAILDKTTLTIQTSASALPAIAQLPDVLWIEPSYKNVKEDESQALIMASQTNGFGHGPMVAANYLNFLNALGFSTDPAKYPILDVADSGLDTPNPYPHFIGCFGGDPNRVPFHPSFFVFGQTVSNAMCCELFETRVAYSIGPDTDGHGTIVASVANGYDDLGDEIINCYLDENGSLDITNGTTVSNAPACIVITNKPPNLIPNPFPVTLQRLDFLDHHVGLGVSPYARFGASAGGAADGFLGAADEILNAYLNGARISNNSWGEGLVVGGNDGAYNSLAQSYDALVRDAVPSTNTLGAAPKNQEMIIVFAGGNSGGGGTVGGYGDVVVTPPATAKNVISVGASEGVQPIHGAEFGSLSDDSFDIATFNSFGPTRDGRFKPEIVAPGTAITGARSQALYTQQGCFGCNPNNNPANLQHCSSEETLWPTISELYGTFGGVITFHYGTSFSAPAVSGGMQLLWWWFQNKLNVLQPSAAMAKAYLLNSARYLSITNPITGSLDTLPSSAQGMGIMDLRRMFDGVPRVLRDETTSRAIDTPLVTAQPVVQQTFFSQSGQSYEVGGQVADASQPFRVTVSWTDAPGTPLADKELVNDLDLEVTVGGQTYKGNEFVGGDSVTGCPDPNRPCPDNINNTESVFLPAGQTGAWSVVVKAINIAGKGVPNVNADVGQDYALVVYNAATNAFGNVSASTDSPNMGTNDTCQTAITVTGTSFSFTNTLSKAVYSNVHPSPSAARGGVDEFFRIPKPTPGGSFTIDTAGSSFDNVLSVWRVQAIAASASVASECGALVEIASHNGGSAPSTVSFTADGSNDYFVVVEPHGDGPGGTMVLNVNASAPAISVTPSSLAFPDQTVGSTGDVQAVTYQNGTSADVSISSVSITGSNASEFVIISQSCAGKTLPAGDSCVVQVAFAPTNSGSKVAQLVINDDATGGQRTVELSGTGIPPSSAICLSRSSIPFGTVGLGSTSAVQSVTVTNCGLLSLTISNVAIVGANASDFQIVSNSCSVVSTGGTCSVGVTFAPTAEGARAASLAITNDSLGSPRLVSLTGSGSLILSQPDAAIGKNTKLKKMIGLGVVNTTGANEEFVQKIKRGKTRGLRFFVALENIGSSADQFAVEGDGNGGGFTVKYFLGAADTTDISTAVESGTHASSTLAPSAITGDATMMRIEVFADKNVPKNTVKTFTLRFTSVGDPTKVDTVKATVIAR